MKILDINSKHVEACAVIPCNGYLLSLSTISRLPDLRVLRDKPRPDGTREDVTDLIFDKGASPNASAENIQRALYVCGERSHLLERLNAICTGNA